MTSKAFILTVQINRCGIWGLYIRLHNKQDRTVHEHFVTYTAPYVAILLKEGYTLEIPEVVANEFGRTYQFAGCDKVETPDRDTIVLNYAPKFVFERSVGSLQTLPLPN